MLTKTARLLLLSIFLFFLSSIWAGKTWAAPSIILTPASQSLNAGSVFNLQAGINVETQQAFGADVVLRFPPDEIEITGVTNGGFFSDFNYGLDNANGRVEIHGFFASLYESKSGNGTFANIAFKGKNQTGGVSNIIFVCTGTGADTQILNTQGGNILPCTGLQPVTVTFISTQVYPTNTQPPPNPTNTTAPGQPVATTTPTNAPSSHNDNPTCMKISIEPSINVYTNSQVNITCTGVDPDGDITAIYYDFGDKSVYEMKQNIGSPASFTTTHSYLNPGSYTVTCKIRDNNFTYSSIPDSCKKTITVSKKVVTIPTATPGRIIAIANPTPERVIVATYVSPTPMPFVTDTYHDVIVDDEFDDKYAPGDAEKSLFTPGQIILGILGIIGVIGIIIFIKNRTGNNRPPNPPVILNDQSVSY